MMIKLSPSALSTYWDCPYQYYLKYVLKIRPEADSINLVLGRAIHKACTDYIIAKHFGMTHDTVDAFISEWQQAIKTSAISYSTKFTDENTEEVGVELCRQFPKVWNDSGMRPLLDHSDQPVVEKRFEMMIEPDVRLAVIPDVVAITPQNELAAIDIKTPSSPTPEEFAINSEQLAIQQIVLRHNASALQRSDFSKGGFLEMIKRPIPKTKQGKGPTIEPLLLVPAMDQYGVDDLIRKIKWAAWDIKHGRFFKNPRMAWNTPCDLCDFRGLCTKGDESGLIRPDQAQRTLSLAA
jgi:hypothetical protein